MDNLCIWVDADACPVRRIITSVAKARGVPVVFVSDSAHQIADGYAQTIVVDTRADSADYALVSRLQRGQVVVTQDYGLAAMALGKGAHVLDQNGMRYTAQNIDRLLMERHLSAKHRRSGGRTRGPKPRTAAQDVGFEQSLIALLAEIL